MVRRGRPIFALLTVVCIVSAAVAQTPRGCSVCPVGCPMHSAPAQGARPDRLGCHQGTASATHHAPEPETGCTVRATCGYLEHGMTSVPAVPPGRGVALAVRCLRAGPVEAPRAPDVFGPEPAGHPPKILRV